MNAFFAVEASTYSLSAELLLVTVFPLADVQLVVALETVQGNGGAR